MAPENDFRPNPYETEAPGTAREAIEDGIRYLALQTSRENVVNEVEKIDVAEVILAVQGALGGKPIRTFEVAIGNTIDFCVRKGLLKTPAEALGVLQSVKEEVMDGGVFVGTEKGSQHSVR